MPHRGLATVFVLAGVVAAAGLARARPAAAQQNRGGHARVEVERLVFDGNDRLSDGELASVIQSRQTRCATALLTPLCVVFDLDFSRRRGYLDTLAVQQDVLRLQSYYAARGFLSAQVGSRVEMTDSGEAARIEFTIDEGPATIISALEVTGLPYNMSERETLDLVGIEPGAMFDRIRLQAAKDSLLAELAERGHIRATILEDTRHSDQGTAQVGLGVRAGPRFRIGEIRVHGEGAIGEGVVRALMVQREGDYYSQPLTDQSQRELFALDAVRFASISVTPGGGEATAAEGEATADLDVQITLAPEQATRGGLGWSTNQCVQTEARLTHRNFLGGGKRLALIGALKNIAAEQLSGSFPCQDVGSVPAFQTLNYLVRLEMATPAFLSGRNTLVTGLFAETETIPDVFIRHAVGAEIALSRTISRDTRAGFSWTPSYTGMDERTADVFFCINFYFCTIEAIEIITGTRWLSPVAGSWRFSRTDDPLQPSRGFYVAGDAELAASWTGSDYEYLRAGFQVAAFQELTRSSVLGLQVRMGALDAWGIRGLSPDAADADTDLDPGEGLAHPSKRFFGGGAHSVRGFGQNLLGPRVLVAYVLEDCPDEIILNCVERLAAESPRDLDQRPTGGDRSITMSVEMRHQLGERWGATAFLDGGTVWDSSTGPREAVVTPGVGLRFNSPIGPLRIDVAYNPSGAEMLPVAFSLPNGTLATLSDAVSYDLFAFDDPPFGRELLRRLQFHVAIGEAF